MMMKTLLTTVSGCLSSVGEFIDKLVGNLNKLIPHSYIAKSQASFFKSLKETVSLNAAVASMDFSKTFAFTMQEEAQGYHWTSNSQLSSCHDSMQGCKQ